MLEYFGGTFLYGVAKDVWRATLGRRRRLTSSEIVGLREKWRTTFDEKMRDRNHRRQARDVIVRDVSRPNVYPDIDKPRRGASSWFKVGLVDTYHRGLLAVLSWETIVRDGEGWRYTRTDEKGQTVGLVGEIPYENIETVNWDGDEFYREWQIFCHFSRGVPYERLAFYEENSSLPNHTFYTEVATYDAVVALSRTRGTTEHHWIRRGRGLAS